MKRILPILVILVFCSCSGDETSDSGSFTFTFPKSDPEKGLLVDLVNGSVLWNFKTLEYWPTESPTMVSGTGYRIQGDTLRLITHKGTAERPKVRTAQKIYGFGKYTWRVYVPMPGIGDRTSVGAFLYSDDQHEIDFEIGYGTSAIRKTLSAIETDMVVYLTSQDNPVHKRVALIESNKWYNLSLELKNTGGKYNVIWSIDDKVMTSVQTDFGSSETLFYIYCSLENLNFIGDYPATQDNYCLFNYVEYKPYL